MNSDELRTGFLKFFSERSHEVCKSDLLIPRNDPTLLFTPAGMNQFKENFLGLSKDPFKRATTCQKCMRMPDLENVGLTASHHTFFEMLGNFSFGDYFKREAIAWSLEYLVDELGLNFKDLYISVYKDDDESADIWRIYHDVPESKIFRFGEKDNFWPAEAPSKGPNGVCGPCSEIYVDLKGGCGKADCDPSCECGRFIEVWNLVFTQFNRFDGGVLEPLPFKNIDTGMGFERLLRVLNGAETNYDTDLFMPVINLVSELSGREYRKDKMDTVRMRRISDHIRAAVFGISDGASPSNEKQGYIIRKVLRRAMMDGQNLGIEGSFLHKLVEPVVTKMENAYPELSNQKSEIERQILQEENKFAETYNQGISRLSVMIGEMENNSVRVLPGKSAFILYDTFGFPLDLAQRTLAEHGFTVDIDGFNSEMEEQRAKARKGSVISDKVFDAGPLGDVKGDTQQTVFVGYDKLTTNSKILHILTDKGLVDSISEGERASIVLDETTFYAEAGGQLGDTGIISSDHFTFVVDSGTVNDGGFYLHTGIVTEGVVSKGVSTTAVVDRAKRSSIQGNHTATHLLHFHLRETLGNHVEQKGSRVEPSRLRFDFHHTKPMTQEEINTVQNLVNKDIRANTSILTEVRSLDEARKSGAMALFGEKYGDSVRVVSVDNNTKDKRSVELCGGCHVGRTGEIGSFRIISEESIAAGIRRIEAASGEGLEKIIDEKLLILQDLCNNLKVTDSDLPRNVKSLQDQLKENRKVLKKIRSSEAAETAKSLLNSGIKLAGGQVLYSGIVEGLQIEDVRKMSDSIRSGSKEKAGIILLSIDEEKVLIVAAFDEPFIQHGVRAGDVCKIIGTELGGGGGGKPSMAQGQGKNPAKADSVLKKAIEKIVNLMNN